ncbi:MAG: polysaccharide deacetylase family protein [Ruminococcus sp.]
MYECCNVKRFFRLLLLDAVILGICLIFFCIGKAIVFSAEDEERIFMPAIMYHSVCESSPQKYLVTPKQLESDLNYLKTNGYTAVTAEQLINFTQNKGELPENPVLLTFDDGFYNNLSILLPLLEKYDMHAIVSVVGSYIDYNAAADPHVDRYSYLTWEDIDSLIKSGRVEIGNHTYNMHSSSGGRKGCSKMNGESTEEYCDILNRDINLLQAEIHDHDDIIPTVFAYPFGYISPEALPVLKESGFFMTLTCYERPNYITRNPECLYGIDRYNRSGLLTTEEFMRKALAE